MTMPKIPTKADFTHRNEDDQFAHVATGEFVVPRQVTTNPKYQAIMDALAAAIRDQGGDPSSAVVGNPDGNYNPDTGHQEFFLDNLFSLESILGGALGAIGGAAAPELNTTFDTNFFTPSIGAGLGAATGNFIATQDLTQSAGAGLGAVAGKYLAQEFYSDPDKNTVDLSNKNLSFGDRLSGSFSGNNLYGTAGLYLGQSFGANMLKSDEPLPNPTISTPSVTGVNIPTSSSFGGQLQTTNVGSLGEQSLAPQGAGITGVAPGVSYLSRVLDRDTGEETLRATSQPNTYTRGYGSQVVRI